MAPVAFAEGKVSVASLEAKLETIQEDIRSTTGELERIDHQFKQYVERLDKVQGDHEFRFQQQEKMIQQLEELNQQTQDKIRELEEKIDELSKMPMSTVAPSSPSSVKTKNSDDKFSKLSEPPTPTAKPSEVVKNDYEKAYQVYLSGDYKNSEKAMEHFIAEHGDNDLVGNAYYWLGESLGKQGKTEKASIQYLKCFKTFPKGNKASDCLFKLGVSLDKMGKKKEACVTFEKLLQDFPQLVSSSTEMAKKEIERMQCHTLVVKTKSTTQDGSTNVPSSASK